LRAEDLIGRHASAWREATRHPFLEAVRDGTLPPEAFDLWLAQDYLFVADLLAFQSRLLARTPRRGDAQAVLAGGLVGAEAELGWFKEKARERGLGLGVSRLPATAEYRELMSRLEAAPYAAAITALWAIERAYLEAWRSAKPPAAYTEFVEHWTTPEFAEYVAGLERADDDALANAGESEQEAAEEAFLEVARLERDFWEMAWRRRVEIK
jgi:thiaminase/transcriptional activator TenA